MEKLIEFQKEIKNWDIEKLLDKLCSESYWAYNLDKKARKEYEGKILLLKMKIVSRTK